MVYWLLESHTNSSISPLSAWSFQFSKGHHWAKNNKLSDQLSDISLLHGRRRLKSLAFALGSFMPLEWWVTPVGLSSSKQAHLYWRRHFFSGTPQVYSQYVLNPKYCFSCISNYFYLDKVSPPLESPMFCRFIHSILLTENLLKVITCFTAHLSRRFSLEQNKIWSEVMVQYQKNLTIFSHFPFTMHTKESKSFLHLY